VVDISWDDAKEFMAKTGLALPTEAQWEYARRAGQVSRKVADLGWYGENSGGGPHAVGKKAPNGFGIHDMHGNVAEYCADGFRGDFYASCGPVCIDPICLDAGSGRVARGGSWLDAAEDCRSAARARVADPKSSDLQTGFRPVFSSLPYPLP
jgi:formylglycine-generating enzyme required for sulfatase activity